MIPSNLRVFFWDIDPSLFNPHDYPVYTITRVLEYGDLGAVEWLRQNFSEEEIKEVIRSEQTLSPRSANFWGLVYGISKRHICALQLKLATEA